MWDGERVIEPADGVSHAGRRLEFARRPTPDRTRLVRIRTGIGLSGCDPRAQTTCCQARRIHGREAFIEVHAQLQLLEAAHRQHMLKGDRDRTRARYRASILKQPLA